MEEGNIVNLIRVFRFHYREMTQQDLADRVGVTRQTIHTIEDAKYSPSLELALKMLMNLMFPWKMFFNMKPNKLLPSIRPQFSF